MTVHPPLPLHAPPQPVKANPCEGLTVSAIAVPPTKLPAQTLPQLMPDGALTTVPPFEGEVWMLRLCDCGVGGLVPVPLLPELLLGPLLVVKDRTGATPPPHPTKRRDSKVTIGIPSFASRPQDRFTQSLLPGHTRPTES